MLIILEESTDPPADNSILARDIDGSEHDLTVVVRAGMVCIQDHKHQACAYIMPTAAALELGLRLIRACIATGEIAPPKAGSAGRSVQSIERRL